MTTLSRCLMHALLAALTLLTAQAHAHKASDSYLTLTRQSPDAFHMEWHIALRDLDSELRLDANDDGQLRWGEVRSRWSDIESLAQAHLGVQSAVHICTIKPQSSASPALVEHSDGQYAVLKWVYLCHVDAATATPTSVTLDYKLFTMTDPTHRGLIKWQQAGQQGEVLQGTAIMGPQRPRYVLAFNAPSGATEQATSDKPSTIGQFIVDGISHISQGLDHILFLMTLLLVAVWWRRSDGTWQPRPTAMAALTEALTLVSAFTVAHSITLAIAAFNVWRPSSQWVEILIAVSVAVAALDNLTPLLKGPRWRLVFVFGLIHGFGFASALQDLGLSGKALILPLLGFNIGVELGQVALLLVVFPITFLLRKQAAYANWIVKPASLAIVLLALVWVIERATGETILGWGS